MKNTAAAVILIILVLSSACYIKYRKNNHTTAVMNSFPDYVSEYSNNMSFSDLGESIYKWVMR